MQIHVGRNSIKTEILTLVKLEEKADFENDQVGLFDCGDDDLNEFFREDAFLHKKELIAETYIAKPTGAGAGGASIPFALVSYCNDVIDNKVVFRGRGKKRVRIPANQGFYDGVVTRNIDESYWSYPQYPAVKIARLGVHKDYKRQGVGGFIIEMTKRFFLEGNRTGCRFITVDAYNDPGIIDFYKNQGFDFIIQDAGQAKRQQRALYFDLMKYSPMIFDD